MLMNVRSLDQLEAAYITYWLEPCLVVPRHISSPVLGIAVENMDARDRHEWTTHKVTTNSRATRGSQ